MKEHSLLSPEKVYLDLNLAGIGSRFVAFFIDNIFISLLMGLIILGIFLLGTTGLLSVLTQNFQEDLLVSWLIAAVIFTVVVILFGYFILFETIWNGQTPGKMFLKIRVVQDNGSPVTFLKVLIRNILRIIDALPTAYAAGIIAILISKKNQRLGDMAAGTVVVRENVAAAPAAIDYEVIEYPWSGTARLHIHEISESEFAVLKKYLLRRTALQQEEVYDLEHKLALFFCQKLGLNPVEIERPAIFLEQVAAMYQRR